MKGRFDGPIGDAVAGACAEPARPGRVTRARLTQIMNVLNLAPDVQEEVLFLPPVATEARRGASSEKR